MTRTDVEAQAMGNLMVFVTSRKIYIKQGNQMRIYDLRREDTGAGPYSVQITKEYLDRLYASIRPWLALFAAILFFFFFFIWKLLAALFYSWFGLLINFLRRPRLNYGAIFDVSAFALTPVIWIQAIYLLVPAVAKLPFGFFGSFLLTFIYLVFAIKGTQEREPQPTL
jgi:hypothetical protein